MKRGPKPRPELRLEDLHVMMSKGAIVALRIQATAAGQSLSPYVREQLTHLADAGERWHDAQDEAESKEAK